MTYVNLLGDSIIDNKVYVNPGELSVKEHLEDQSGYVFNQLAVDGHTTSDVIEHQLDKVNNKLTTHNVLSIGGNDLLGHLGFLKNNIELTAIEMLFCWHQLKIDIEPLSKICLNKTLIFCCAQFTKAT